MWCGFFQKLKRSQIHGCCPHDDEKDEVVEDEVDVLVEEDEDWIETI